MSNISDLGFFLMFFLSRPSDFFQTQLREGPKNEKLSQKTPRNERFRTRYESCQNLSVQLRKFAKLQHFYESGGKIASQLLILDIEARRRSEQRALSEQWLPHRLRESVEIGQNTIGSNFFVFQFYLKSLKPEINYG